MKNKFSNGRFSYFFTPRIHGNLLAWIKPASESERSKRAMENILRWEDDGGKLIGANHSTSDQKRRKESIPVPPCYAPAHGLEPNNKGD